MAIFNITLYKERRPVVVQCLARQVYADIGFDFSKPVLPGSQLDIIDGKEVIGTLSASSKEVGGPLFIDTVDNFTWRNRAKKYSGMGKRLMQLALIHSILNGQNGDINLVATITSSRCVPFIYFNWGFAPVTKVTRPFELNLIAGKIEMGKPLTAQEQKQFHNWKKEVANAKNMALHQLTMEDLTFYWAVDDDKNSKMQKLFAEKGTYAKWREDKAVFMHLYSDNFRKEALADDFLYDPSIPYEYLLAIAIPCKKANDLIIGLI